MLRRKLSLVDALYGIALAVTTSLLSAAEVRVTTNVASDDCNLRLISRKQPDKVLSAPCREELMIPAGDYFAWFEQAGKISRSMHHLSLPGGSTYQVNRIPDELTAAGRVRIDVPRDAARVEIFSAAAAPREVSFRRVAFASESQNILTMPAGEAVAVAHDANDNLISITEPMKVGPTAIAIPHFREKRCDLVVQLLPPTGDEADAFEGLTVGLGLQPQQRLARFLLTDSEGPRAIWYDLGSAAEDIVAKTRRAYSTSEARCGEAQKPLLVRQRLIRLPSLVVSVTSTSNVAQDISLKLLIRAGDQLVAERRVKSGESIVLNDMPLDLLEISLIPPTGSFSQRVDLRSGADGHASFELTPIVLQGRVTYGGQATRARILFLGRVKSELTTDEDGMYRVVLWHTGRYGLKASLVDHPEVGAFDENIRIDEDRTYDIVIPRNQIRIRTVSSSDGTALADVEVYAVSASGEADQRERFFVKVLSEPSGLAKLPPIRPGQLEIHARKTGYRDATLSTTITKETAEQDITIRLVSDAEPTLTLMLPSGAVADHCDIIVASESTGQILSSTVSDEAGRAAISHFGDELVIVRHPLAATDVMRARDVRALSEWRLRSPGPSLHVHIVDAGNEPVASATLTLFLRGFTLTGAALAAASHFASRSAVTGDWMFFHPPPDAIALLARKTVSIPTVRGLATAIDFPWPGDVTIRVVD